MDHMSFQSIWLKLETVCLFSLSTYNQSMNLTLVIKIVFPQTASSWFNKSAYFYFCATWILEDTEVYHKSTQSKYL